MHRHIQLSHYLHVSETTELYVSVALRGLAVSLIGIFIPVILYTNNYSFLQIIQYYIVLASFSFMMFMVAVELMSKVGVKHVMMFNVPFLVIYFGMLFFIETIQWPVMLMAAFHAISSAFFWASFHVEFSTLAHKNNTGRQLGFLNILSQSLSLIAPLLGGITLTLFGEPGITVLGSSIAILSIIPLAMTSDHNVKTPFTTKDLFGRFSWKQSIAFASEGVRSYAALVLWPFYITVAGLGYLAIGGIYFMVRLILIISSFFVGKLADKQHPRGIMRIGTIIHSVSMGTRGFLETAAAFTTVHLIGSFGFVTFNIPLQKFWYEKAKRMGPLYLIRREFYLDGGRIFLLIFAGVIFLLTDSVVTASLASFVLGSLATLLINLAHEKD